jgi:Tol biopolymer transport system component
MKLLVVGFAIALVLAASAGASRSTVPGRNGLIGYQRGDQNPVYDHINVVRPGGRDGHAVQSGTHGYGGNPAWSPNGKLIAFERLVDTSVDVFVMRADGTHTRDLSFGRAENEWDGNPAWSPDGTKIAFDTTRLGDGYDIYVMNADGTGQHPIVAGPGDQRAPAWSPDGTRIAYASGELLNVGANPAATSSIWTVAPDGSERRRLTNADGVSDDPAWSPDGTKIAFESNRDGDYEVYVMNADGSVVRDLTNHPALDASPAWSPDGKKIAFTSDRSAKIHREIYVMNADGSHVVRMTRTLSPNVSMQPDWQSLH